MRQIRLSREDEKRGTTSPSTAALDAISFLDGKVESMNETLETMSRQINTTLTSMQTQIKSVSSVFGEWAWVEISETTLHERGKSANVYK